MTKRKYSVPALEKGLSIIEILAKSPVPLGVTDIYESNKLPKSTIFMILTTLEELNYLQKTEDGKYRLTLKLYNIGMELLSKMDLRNIARPLMEELAAELRVTVHLAILENGKATYIEKVKGPGFVQFSTEVGQSMLLHNSGVGKVLAAFLPKDTLASYLQLHGMPATTEHTITSPERFSKFLENVRESGFAIEDEEGELGIRCIAAPIYDHTGAVAAALSITALRSELPSISFPEAGRKVKQKAMQISFRLGYDRTEEE
ncbi:IclR family transcriptional regulator [Paenibacillus sp. CC-CFT747]|nr:IclR family transcriptional regulator [Paenibacillus sp. CC-CFT747]